MVTQESLAPSREQLETLRDLFFKKYEKEPPPCGEFHPDDLNNIKSNDKWLGRYLIQCDLDMKQSLDLLWGSCTWRKNIGANDLNESNIRMDYVNAGIAFPRNKDIDGKTLLIFKTKMHTKGSKDMDELMKGVAYWIERILRENNYDSLTIFFDMQGTGLSNMDLDFVKKIVEMFKFYYPNSLNYIIIYEMPWVLNAAFKIIKGLLPPKAVAKMKFLSAKTIREYVTEENLLTSWGGKDDYQFKFEPEKTERKSKRFAVEKASEVIVNENNNEVLVSPGRKVHFANPSPQEMSATEEHFTPNEAEMLRITPQECIVFKPGDKEHEFIGTVDILCTSKQAITYKIKTTSPEKFLVRPSSGILTPGASVSINVILQRGHQLSPVSKDKFLVMSMILPESMDTHASLQQISELWKSKGTNNSSVENHRLRCIGQQAQGDGVKNGHVLNQSYGEDSGDRRQGHLSETICQLSDQTRRLEQQLKFTQNLQWITLFVIVLLSVAIVYILKQDISENGTRAGLRSPLDEL